MNANFAQSFQEVEHRMEQLTQKIKYMNNSNNPHLEKHPGGGILQNSQDKIYNAQQSWLKEYSKYQISKHGILEGSNKDSNHNKKVSFKDQPIYFENHII